MKDNQFVYRNIIRSVIWLLVFLAIYICYKRFVKVDMLSWLEPLFKQEGLVYLIFLLSESIIGIIPPEIFMIWALRFEDLYQFILVVFSLSLISYFAGGLGYYFGRYLNTTKGFRYLRRRFLKKTEQRLNQFGLYLIIISALTPLPFSGVAMLVGSVKYPIQRYLLFSLSRFARFAIYAWVFWNARTLA